MKSPIAHVIAEETLPELFHLQFCHTPEKPYAVKVAGHLHHIWYRPAWIYPMLWLLEKAGILVSEKGEMIPTTLVVTAALDSKQNPIQIWQRRFFGKKTRKFDVKVVFDPQSKRAIDLVGIGKILALAWEITCHNDELHINVVQAGIRFFDKFLWIPNPIWPLFLGRETFTQKLVPGKPDEISIDLLITHPILGKVFGYDGQFKVEKILN